MNYNSRICRFIYEHPVCWETVLANAYSIKVKKEGNYAIFNYGFDCDYSNPIVQEARGIIIDFINLEVVCWPFRKFGNYNESYADVIDWNSAKVLEKVDGSIIKLWYDFAKDRWQFSTNGTICAEKAPIDAIEGLTFADIILKAENCGDIPFDKLDKDYTYIFELVSPETQVVVKYDKILLYHIGTRNNNTGMEVDVNIGVIQPKAYPLCGLEQCVKAATELNQQTMYSEDEDITNEGFVVVDKNWNRVKVKSPDYIMMHSLRQMSSIKKRDCIAMLLKKSEKIKIICDSNPHLIPVFKYYDFRLAELKLQADKLGELSRLMYKEYSRDRAAVAKIITKHKLSTVAFKCLDTGEEGGKILFKLPIEKISKLIPDYEQEDLYSLFVM